MNKAEHLKIDEALTLLNEAARDKKQELDSLLTEKYSDLKAAMTDMEVSVEDHAILGAQRLGELKAAAAGHVKETAHAVDSKAHEEPWKTLGWAVAGAFAAGFLLGRKD